MPLANDTGTAEQAGAVAGDSDPDVPPVTGIDGAQQLAADHVHDADLAIPTGDGELSRLMRHGGDILDFLPEALDFQGAERDIASGRKVVPLFVPQGLRDGIQRCAHGHRTSVFKGGVGEEQLGLGQGSFGLRRAGLGPAFTGDDFPHKAEAGEQQHGERGSEGAVPEHQQPELLPRAGGLGRGGVAGLISIHIGNQGADTGVALLFGPLQGLHRHRGQGGGHLAAAQMGQGLDLLRLQHVAAFKGLSATAGA